MPFPANYGGVIDVYYKLYWLKKAGVSIHLHCFTYGRKPSAQLEALCAKVHYYERQTGFLANLSLLPYTVKSRQSAQLAENLLSNDFPILFEVLHTCDLLNDKRFKNRTKIYRHSNIEHEYYRELSKIEKNVLKKVYLKLESFKLKRFESIVNFADIVLAVNKKDAAYFEAKYTHPKTLYLPSFHQHRQPDIKTGSGNYVLFHGNLSISENYESACWLIKNVFHKLPYEVIIAGLNPPDFLSKLVNNYPGITLLANPGHIEMEQLVADAQVHVLYTAQPTGLKLKLLNVLFGGRFIVCNPQMVSGTSLKSNMSFSISGSPDDYVAQIIAAFNRPFLAELLTERKQQCLVFDNRKNAGALINAIYE